MSFWHESNAIVARSPLSMAQQVQLRGPGRWRARLTFENRNRAVSAQLDALLAELDGGAGEVLLFDFRRPAPRGSAAAYSGPALSLAWPAGLDWPAGLSWPSFTPLSPPQLAVAAARGAASVLTTGWIPGSTVLRAGDYVGLGSTLHIVTADVTANGDTEATIPLRPRLRGNLAAGTAVVTDRPTVRMRLTERGVENPTTPGPFSTYAIELEESLP